ncbi:aspartate--tRNA ligase [Algisphaera agarilytica]|uniref:Aspartate--tRNA(Asp/Asn) ligase n=1 Tax=Algisphaera agarilytica TaxID=1385975 RepID=A0A7X0LLF3_9BACT|nr:aspartate--tRNA ligase [Algisphaera agarilytica]MBB6431445.1 aspartyl-tRNA synthetase [Algisphaera agarilytica]
MNYRTHTCGELRETHLDQTVTLSGWVNNYRDHGGVRFIDLRDREGITQIVFHPEAADAHAVAQKLRREDVITVTGKCIVREGGENPKLATGKIEVDATEAIVLNDAANPPFIPDEAEKVGEETRLRYRYVDLRRPAMQHILKTRHRVTKITRDYFDEQGFYEVETPFLCRSTPEGARDFLVPSRLQEGEFYALPQSPQLFKQILMVGGIEKYIQIARCFRDEDPRADRQAEFTQVDMEMAFVEQEDVMSVNEGLMRRIWKDVLDIEIPNPIKRMTYADAMNDYGSDRPDLRFDMKLIDVSDLATQTDFKVFSGAVEKGGIVKAIRVPGGAKMTRKETDALAEWVKQFGAGGLPICKVEGGTIATGVAKFLMPIAEPLVERMGAEDGDLICFGVDPKPATVHRVLGELRVKLAHDLEMIDPKQAEWLWVVDFPMVEWSEDKKRWDSLHHPFTAPNDEDLDKLDSDDHDTIASIKSKAYDLVLNGSEMGGGSIRIHRPDVQSKVFKLLGIDEEEAKAKFGFLLDALNYGAPPHGGLAFGLDRTVMQLVGTSNIRDVIAFPKTQNGADLMTEAPSPVDEEQLKELNLRIQLPVKAPTA